MRRRGGIRIVLRALGVASLLVVPPPSASAETKDRIDPATFSALVSAPMAEVRANGLEAGMLAFEALLTRVKARSGATSLEAADVTSAFGVELFSADYKQASIPYLKRAIEGYRAALPPGDPNLAVALDDYAQVMFQVSPRDLPDDAVAALREALSIRLTALGERNAETSANMVSLGRALAAPARVKQDPERLEEAVAWIRRGIALQDAIAPQDAFGRGLQRFHLAEAYARNRKAGAAVAAGEELLVLSRGLRGPEFLVVSAYTDQLADMLDKLGETTAATRFRAAVEPERARQLKALIPATSP